MYVKVNFHIMSALFIRQHIIYLQVIGRTTRQVKQLRRGLKETMLWPLLTSRPDVVPLIFPRTKEIQYTPQVIILKILFGHNYHVLYNLNVNFRILWIRQTSVMLDDIVNYCFEDGPRSHQLAP